MTTFTDELQIGALVTSSKGGKSAFISRGGGPAVWQPCDAMLPVFEPSSFDGKGSPLNLALHITPEQEAEMRALDEWCLAEVARQSEQLFGKALTAEQLAPCYQPCLKTSEKYPPNIRVKLNLDGHRAVCFWDSNKQRTAAPSSWLDVAFRPIIRIKAVWFMAKQFGIVLELTDAQITEVVPKCPF